jgi:hypothetical protein
MVNSEDLIKVALILQKFEELAEQDRTRYREEMKVFEVHYEKLQAQKKKDEGKKKKKKEKDGGDGPSASAAKLKVSSVSRS